MVDKISETTEKTEKPKGTAEHDSLEPKGKQQTLGESVKGEQQVNRDLKAKIEKADVTNLGFPDAKIGESEPIEVESTIVPGKGIRPVGAFLHIDAAPQRVATEGEKIVDIARKHLGEKATNEEVEAHVSEIARLNSEKVIPGQSLQDLTSKPGETLLLPGHTKNGEIIYQNQDGNKYAYEQGNKLTVTRNDGTGFIRTLGDDGNQALVKESHFGPNAQDKFDNVYAFDGKLLSTTRPERIESTPTKSVEEERRALSDAADRRVALPNERQKFSQDMQEFEQRAKEQGLSKEEVARTYHDMKDILMLKGESPLTGRERVRLVTGALDSASSPRSISQGDYETCQTNVIEARMFSKEPSKATDMLAQIAKTGEFTTVDGTKVKMDEVNLRAHGESALNLERGAWARTYTSQVFQTAAINAALKMENEREVPPKDIRYLQTEHTDLVPEPKSDRILPSESQALPPNGEKLLDYNENPPKLIGEQSTTGNPEQMRSLYQQLTGHDRPDLFLVPKEMADQYQNYKAGSTFANKEELGEMLSALRKKETGDIYAPIIVHANSDTLLPTRRRHPLIGTANPAKIDGDLHTVNVIDYDEKTGMVKVDASWGNKRDFIEKPITLEQLYNATQFTPGATWMDRLEQLKPEIKPEDFNKQLSSTTQALVMRWIGMAQSDIEPPQGDIDKTIRHYKEMRQGLDKNDFADSDMLVIRFEAAIRQMRAQQKKQQDQQQQ
ncbi:hypothetical protein BH11CYA1_BH11CYA1_08800 [soil metagenome]